MPKQTSRIDQVQKIARDRGVLRPSDLDEFGIPRRYAQLLFERGQLERVGRGLYVLAGTPPTEFRSLAEAFSRVPHGTVSLLSALHFHQLTSQNPFEVWIAIEVKARQPKDPQLPIRFVRFSGKAFSYGAETHEIEGVSVRIYSPAKSVADCMKFRNKIGLDVALEALNDCIRQKKATVDELLEAAQVCRVEKVMKPYMEAIL
jgi:predicted transcriptional regulator of viral defense system